MVNIILVQLLILFISFCGGWALAVEQVYPPFLHGEKRLDGYYGAKYPSIIQDTFLGKINFRDDHYYNNSLNIYLFEPEDLGSFIKSEMYSSALCTNEQLRKHSNYIRYAYRLIALSYLLEVNWHMELFSKDLLPQSLCGFDFDKWLDSCRPVSDDMKKFIAQMRKYRPRYKETFPKSYSFQDWQKEFSKKQFNYISHFRLENECGTNCIGERYASELKKSCQKDLELMTLICSEKDELLGLSTVPEAFQLLSQSNIINSFNQQGEAIGCLRRFSVSYSHREVKYKSLNNLFAPLKEHLYRLYQERFIQGRVFFYGSGKEFEDKGLTNLHVMDQPLKIAKLSMEDVKKEEAIITPQLNNKSPQYLASSPPVEIQSKLKPIVHAPQKSAFLIAAEIRSEQDLAQINVDMNKLKYDYVFSLNTLNLLSSKLKTFMTRDAIKEMKTYDKLGTTSGPVPLLFLKYMIDMQEHAGLYNLISVLGNEFYVSNEIDTSFKTKSEKIKIEIGQHTENQWAITILKP